MHKIILVVEKQGTNEALAYGERVVSSQTRLVKPTFFGEENQNIQKLLLPKNKC